ncbi:hypothetical protein [Streptomyces cinereoruber]|uniref:hypothetical protein n=1 Tax=Streptomyces cinereoruber TaxID=67260 RepID=UPI0036382438
MDERAFPVVLGRAAREWGAATAALAMESGQCRHPGARFVSGGDPAAGRWCVSCGARPLGDLLLTPWCSLCDATARPGLTALRAGPVEVLARLCDPCLTSNTPPPKENP